MERCSSFAKVTADWPGVPGLSRITTKICRKSLFGDNFVLVLAFGELGSLFAASPVCAKPLILVSGPLLSKFPKGTDEKWSLEGEIYCCSRSVTK